jgi:hypothetical protein
LPDDLPAGRYPIYLGLYDPETGLRRPLYIGDQRQSNDALLVDWLVVEGG